MSTGSVAPFNLVGSVTIAASSTASATASLPMVGDVLVVSNPNTAAAYVAIGQAAAVGGVNSIMVLPGQKRVLASNGYVSSVSAILAAGSGIIVFECGTGTVF